jgi:transposase
MREKLQKRRDEMIEYFITKWGDDMEISDIREIFGVSIPSAYRIVKGLKNKQKNGQDKIVLED